MGVGSGMGLGSGLLVWVGRVILDFGLLMILVLVLVLGLFLFLFGWDTGYRIPDTGGLLYILCIDKHTQKSIKSNT